MTNHGPEEALTIHRVGGAIDLFIYRTSKFKTTLVNLLLHRPLDSGSTPAALVPYLLRRGTETHPDMVSISRHLERLFGASLDVDVLRFGERQILSFRLDVVDERYLLMGGSGLLAQAMTLLRDLLLAPRLDGGRFPEEVFEVEHLNLLRFLEGMVNDKGRYALDRCIRHMCDGEPYARCEYGEIDELDGLTAADATECWKRVLRTAPMEIYVVGSSDPDQVIRLVEDLFAGIRDGESIVEPPVPSRKHPGRVRRIREHMDVMQARLVMGYRSEVDHEHNLCFPLNVWNTIFGGGSFSRLFKNVRERHSLAYYCSSSVDQAKGICMVQAGIDGTSTEKVERIVRRQMTELRRERIDLAELRAAKAYLLAGLRSITDSPARIAGFFQERHACGSAITFEDAEDRIRRVRRREVSAAARTLKLDTVYLLGNGAP